MSRLKIVIDLGSSATKVVYTWGEEPLQQFMMSPFCAPVPASYPQKMSWGELGDHLEDSWVKVGEDCALLGKSARKHYRSGIGNEERKISKALFKCLGILAALHRDRGESLPIDLGVLLPFDEYLTRETLIETLLQAETVSYCGLVVSLNINDVVILPEGAGLFAGWANSRKSSKCTDVAVLVIGHRNLSWLKLKKGKPIPSECRTNLFGFRWLVEEVSVRSGYKDELGLARMIFLGEDLDPDLEKTIKECMPIYWEGVKAFLLDQEQVDYVICGGGAASLFQKSLKTYFGRKLGWANELTKELKGTGIQDPVERRRYADAYGILKTL